MQYKDPKNYTLVHEALELAHREDLIGFGPQCLIRPRKGESAGKASSQQEKKPQMKSGAKQPQKPASDAKQSSQLRPLRKNAAPSNSPKQANAPKKPLPMKNAQPPKSAANAKKLSSGRARKAPAKRNP